MNRIECVELTLVELIFDLVCTRDDELQSTTCIYRIDTDDSSIGLFPVRLRHTTSSSVHYTELRFEGGSSERAIRTPSGLVPTSRQRFAIHEKRGYREVQVELPDNETLQEHTDGIDRDGAADRNRP